MLLFPGANLLSPVNVELLVLLLMGFLYFEPFLLVLEHKILHLSFAFLKLELGNAGLGHICLHVLAFLLAFQLVLEQDLPDIGKTNSKYLHVVFFVLFSLSSSFLNGTILIVRHTKKIYLLITYSRSIFK